MEGSVRIRVNLKSFSYPYSNPILKDIFLEVKGGEFLVILGASGVGKTTLLKLIDGLFKKYEGEIFLDGIEIRKLRPKEIYRKMGLLFQNPEEQLFATTVFEDVAFGPRNMNFSEEEVKTRVGEALSLVEMSDYQECPISHLSYGQKKRVCLAGLLAMGHEILLLDEPTQGLDPLLEKNFLNLLLKLKKEKALTLIMATHQVDLVPYIADKVAILHNKTMAKIGTPHEIFNDPEELEKYSLRLPSIGELFFEVWKKFSDGSPLPLTVEEGKTFLKKKFHPLS
ncbi:MAG: energy-coupling factor ABC transporter ATP-binding protein [Thermodesulfobacteriaceae bacterium]|nr:energy-coupling factor ABC transporter ATP-binding protein [Caldimicrobium sp.]MCX8041503.1 energy-coupling factor ABC transporter ATP-binding protein [Thermodesulfobacteriaceae bacterium]MDW8135475.1 ATP-binding cassette domain-containing protein [Thermodesulfobacterium sp.]